MLRSLDSGVSGLQAQQTMLDVVGNNIANVNTTGYKSSSVEFEDTLSQMIGTASAPQGNQGGQSPAQVGLGVRVAATATNFTEGAAQTTGVGTNLMINGDGFFIVNNGGQTQYTRSGAFTTDAAGNLVSPDGAIVQGWNATNGVVNSSAPVSNITLSTTGLSAARATSKAAMTGNLADDAAVGATVNSQVTVYDANGAQSNLTMAFTRNGTGGWDVTGTDAAGNTASGLMTFASGVNTGAQTLTVGAVTVDLSKITGFAGSGGVNFASQNGTAAGSLQSFSIEGDGTIMGAFSNGEKQAVGRVALANFTNPGGLQKAGNSNFIATPNSGLAQVGQAGSGSLGTMTSGAIEGSNVDLAREFTNLIVAQRAFQASARVITTSDDVLQELLQLKTQ
ncbi:flagellar hook protein FlgE [Leifsonia sp. EB34]|uniref:flagellar hook protein FlgE n=1 Tax=Leifsonia sp. EB34 TaxID=3156303 RepID=UPI0035183015